MADIGVSRAAVDMPRESLLATGDGEAIHRLATGHEPGGDGEQDDNGIPIPRGYKNRLLAILGLARLVVR